MIRRALGDVIDAKRPLERLLKRGFVLKAAKLQREHDKLTESIGVERAELELLRASNAASEARHATAQAAIRSNGSMRVLNLPAQAVSKRVAT